jgi:ATP-dependent RNA helicase RhlE
MSYNSRFSAKRSAPLAYSSSNRRHRQSGGRNKKYIDPSRFVKAATGLEAEAYNPRHLFADFALEARLQSNLAAKGYVTPSPIQDQTIPAALSGKDIIGVASTGTGKTAAFALPILQRLVTDRGSAAIVIAPTRELAQQIEEEFKALGRGTGLMGTLLIGGTNMGGQLRDLRQRPNIVIGTPGRIKDHLERGSLNLNKFNLVVLDEVDRMLDMGFVQDVTEILRNTSPDKQSMFFSATIDPKVQTLINTFADNPLVVSLKASSASENVHQDVVKYRGNMDKLEKLHELLISGDVSKAIVFDETQRSVERLGNELASRGFLTDAIHGGKTQGQRKRALDRFKNNQVNVLVATDVAARGIDVVDISHVVNYSIPNEYEDYIHRIGRAGRAGRVGYALTFVSHN